MDKYLQEILRAYLSVILPELGALSISSEEDKNIVFNSFITYNDEKFENFIVEKHGIEKQNAANMVAQYVKEIQNHINKGESFIIFKFGRFIKGSDGSVEFQNWSEFNKKENTKTPKVVEKIEEITKIETPPVEKKKEAEPIVEQVETKKKNVFTPAPKEEAIVEAKKDAPETKEVKTEKKIVEAKKEKPKKEPKAPKPPKEKKERKKRSLFFYVNIILLALLVTGGILVGVNYTKVQSFLGFNKKEIKQEPKDTTSTLSSDENTDSGITENESIDDTTENNADNQNTDNTSDDVNTEEEKTIETPTEEKAPVKMEKTQPIVNTSGGSYHLIGGGFGDSENAERFAKNLQAKGLPAEVLGRFGELTLVSVQSFETKEAASSSLQSISDQAGVKAWIFKH